MLSGILGIFLAIFGFLVVLGSLVFFHEYGHYKVARLCGVRVETFSIGFGKAIKSWTDKKGTVWKIGRIPLGGYVKFLGDAGAASNPDTQALAEIKEQLNAKYGEGAADECFHFKPLWQRALVVLAGPVANFILAIILFAVLASVFGVRTPVMGSDTDRQTEISRVLEGSAADEAGLLAGDVLLSINGTNVYDIDDVTKIVSLSSGENLQLNVERGGQMITLQATPRREAVRDAIGGESRMGRLGVEIPTNYEIQRKNPIDAVGFGVDQTWETLALTGKYIGRIFQGKEDGSQFGSITKIGTIVGKGTYDVATAEEVPVGNRVWAMLGFWIGIGASLSVALGFANLLPIPVLDGGHLMFYGYEAIAGKPLSEEKQEIGFKLGLVLLLMAFVFLTINDLQYGGSLFSNPAAQ